MAQYHGHSSDAVYVRYKERKERKKGRKIEGREHKERKKEARLIRYSAKRRRVKSGSVTKMCPA